MQLEAGKAYFSKKLNKHVLYIGNQRFVGVAYALTYYLIDDVGELDTLVRNCHYEAAMRSSERFLGTIDEAHTHFSTVGNYDPSWHAALNYVRHGVQVGI